MDRQAGVLMHISSLPNKRGIGSLGRSAYKFVDFLAKAKLKLWQVLPLCPTSYGDSPYQSPSVNAGNPYFIDIDALIKEGLLKETEAVKYSFGYVDYAEVYHERYATLRAAFANFILNPPKEYEKFKANAEWLDDYALFMALKVAHGMHPWNEWEDEYKYRTADFSSFKDEAEFWKFLQYEFYKQWGALKTYANKKGVKIVGDMPIYVAYDSVDVWANPKLFLLRDDLYPEVVAGVPPDYFSADGQLWGNPIYDWEYLKSTRYEWWINRLSTAMSLYDVLRIDHFRGFSDYYAIPFGAESAREGEWRDGPGIDLFNEIKSRLNDPEIIAEDLGELHDCVKELVRDTAYPGMKVLQFAFDGDPNNDFLYHNYTENCVAYTGTHDNDTTRGWFSAASQNDRETVRRLVGEDVTEENVCSIFIEKLLASRANTVIIPMQDFLNLGAEARMNVPSTLGGNWAWRSKDEWTPLAPALADLIKRTER